MPQIVHCRTCTPKEISELRAYLSTTPVRWLVGVIDGGARVSKGEVKSLSQVGRLRTIWGDLGGVRSDHEYGLEKFLVGQVMAVLKKPQCTDKERLDRIENYVKLFANNQLDLKITLMEDRSGITICDGNTRVVACFEYCVRTGQTSLRLPVNVISP
jgi:hypothetical protein